MERKPTTLEEYHRRINRITEYINDHLGEEIDLEMLARRSGFSRWHFHRIMRAFLGEPLGAFITRMRIETAARLLRYSDMAVGEIAYKVGYGVPSSLSKAFRQFYGISPNEYRNNKKHIIMKPEELRGDLDVRSEVREEKPRQVIYVRLTGAYPQMDYCGAWTRLFGFLYARGIAGPGQCPPGTEFLCVYHDDPKVTEPCKLRADVCLTCAAPVKAQGEIGVKTIPGGKYAAFLYKGPYARLNAVYDMIYAKWLPGSGYRPGDTPGFENYLNDPASVPPEELLTEICIPLA